MLARTTSLAAMALCVVWTLWPVPDPDVVTPEVRFTPPRKHAEETERAELALAAFDAPLWVPPAVPEEAAVAAAPPVPALPPPIPFKLQLLAIVRGEDIEGSSALRAALYDPEADRVMILAAGETHGPFTLQRVTPTEAVFSDGRAERMLPLDPHAGGAR